MKLRLTLSAAAAVAAIIAGVVTNAAQAAPAQLEVVHASVAVAKSAAPAPAHRASCDYRLPTSTRVEDIAWAEIGRLESLGFPVCETVWSFSHDMPANIWGLTYQQVSDTDPREVVIMELDEADYAPVDLVEGVRTTVRHEYGHVLAFRSGDEAIDPAHEEAADAVAELLTPASETRTVFYAQTISPAELAAAQDILAPYTAQTL